MLDRTHKRIKKLSPLLINQLSAGEVVTRPSAVVKELLENAIDAKATHIEVRITQGGMGMIEVVDNGEGIHPDDMVMAITRHATSKVADIANLHGINTLGFRGEALAATAAVSRLTLLSCHDESGIGRQLQVTGVLAEAPKLLPVVHNRGTTITVKDLYFNVPARRANLKSIATEFAHIETIVREVALAYADVTLNLFHDHKKRLSLSASDTNKHSTANLSAMSDINSRLPLARLEQALGLELSEHALKVSVDLTPLIQQNSELSYQGIATQNSATQNATHSNISSASIDGWLWPVSHAQSTNTSLPKLLYINGRLVKEPLISNQLRQLAQNAQFDYMGYALYFELPVHWLNVNVHPSKQRIKISSLNNIMAHLSHAISVKLKGTARIIIKPAFDMDSTNISSTAPTKAPANDLSNGFVSDSKNMNPSNNLNASYNHDYKDVTANRSPSNRQVQEKTQLYEHSESYEITSDPSAILTGQQNRAIAKLVASNIKAVDSTAILVTRGIALPKCLDVIESLDYIAELDNKNSLSNLHWLLFYNDQQLFLINEQVWQKSLAALFEFGAQSLDHSLVGADKINQQLTAYATSMSEQDFSAFSTDIERILTSNAIKTLDNKQLLAFMLSNDT